jgi:hypothetical protein
LIRSMATLLRITRYRGGATPLYRLLDDRIISDIA